MDFRSMLMTATALLLSAASFQATAVTVNVQRYPVSADVTNAASGATLNFYTHEDNSDHISFGPATITSVGCIPDESADQPCQLKGLELGIANVEYLIHLTEGATLTEVNRFSGLSITFDRAVKDLKFSAFSFSGDDVLVFLFDENGDFLRYVLVKPDLSQRGCFLRSVEVQCNIYSFHESLDDESIYRVAIGSESAAIYLTRISYTLR